MIIYFLLERKIIVYFSGNVKKFELYNILKNIFKININLN